jgi:hypothetical protein
MAELGLAIVGLVDLCYEYGKALVKTCQAFRAAESELGQGLIRVEQCWLRIEMQLVVLHSLAPELDERYLQAQQNTLQVLSAKLLAANSKLGSMFQTKSSDSGLSTVEAKRWKYAFMKDSVDEAIADMETWQRIFDPTWFLMLKIASPVVQRRLEGPQQQPVLRRQLTHLPAAKNLQRALTYSDNTSEPVTYLGLDGLVPGSVHPVPLSPVSMARRLRDNRIVFIDPVSFIARPSENAVRKDARNFARKLRHADPIEFGLLECKGILKDQSGTTSGVDNGLSFIFNLPPSYSEIMSVRQRILRGPEHDSISDRFMLAQQLVRAVHYVHIYGYVHKNIRPEAILILGKDRTVSPAHGDDDDGDATELAVLVGFDVLRDVDGATSKVGDDDWEKNLYRHPSRQGRSPEAYHTMRHDIYSVGVCLLEIGLWEAFVSYDGHVNSELPAQGDLQSGTSASDRVASVLRLGSALAIDNEDISGPDLLKNPLQLKDSFLALARGKLRRKMGTRYSKVVETCLTCLDVGNADFGDDKEFQDEDGVAVEVRYIQKVLSKLVEIVV